MNRGKKYQEISIFFNDEGNLHERGHGRNITDDRVYDADSDTTTVHIRYNKNLQNNEFMIKT